MRIDSQRTLSLPLAPKECWRLVTNPQRLPIFCPEIEDVWKVESGLVRVAARLAQRRRVWLAKTTLDQEKHCLEMVPAGEGLKFRLLAKVEAAPNGQGSLVTMNFELEPPQAWTDAPLPRIASRRIMQRVLLSSVLFALSAAGVLALPALRLEPVLAAVAYAVVGAAFLVAVALLSKTHRGPRRLFLKSS